mgnify:CR=1 FL=1
MSERKLMPQLYIEYEIRDRGGKLISKSREKAHSWLKQFIQFILANFVCRYGTTEEAFMITIKTVDGADTNAPIPYTVNAHYEVMCSWASAGDDEYGIVVGSNGDANTHDQYALNSKISHGTGSGQLSYSEMILEELAEPITGQYQFRMIRSFTNNSGASIDVREHGLYIKSHLGGVDGVYCVIREVPSTPQTIPDGATLTVRYIFSITVS